MCGGHKVYQENCNADHVPSLSNRNSMNLFTTSTPKQGCSWPSIPKVGDGNCKGNQVSQVQLHLKANILVSSLNWDVTLDSQDKSGINTGDMSRKSETTTRLTAHGIRLYSIRLRYFYLCYFCCNLKFKLFDM